MMIESQRRQYERVSGDPVMELQDIRGDPRVCVNVDDDMAPALDQGSEAPWSETAVGHGDPWEPIFQISLA
ncbi:hypothetical protein [Lyngbya confervoides]|uniref:Uncharacterized protein n=1 Tax=Lyngbya confervoides BDU141951 TaxID=1574623 RepID=A0ABD4T3F8_9CYAN|nr:hypothetical protein [Lyngbya confervoides]MCM1982961.1 hypothetical protein [Lyngbya confervoides BDU141951]